MTWSGDIAPLTFGGAARGLLAVVVKAVKRLAQRDTIEDQMKRLS